MSKPLGKYKTKIHAKCEVIDDNSTALKMVTASIREKYGFDLKPQVDLMYTRSCLVTAGINQNDDGFENSQLWDAKHSIVLKPTNWSHFETNIIGIVYSVSAQDLDGNVLNFDGEVPEGPYELWTEAAVFKLIYPERAQEIKDRHAKGSLFVSMEAWFDDYDYGMYDDEGHLTKLIARNEETSFLDEHLRANNGVGKYEGKRLGRVLRNITFGGYGYVDNPANKRSLISDVSDFEEPDELSVLLRKFMSSKENELMTANASDNSLSREELEATVSDVMDRKSAEHAKAAEEKALQAKATELRDDNTSLVKKLEATQASLNDKTLEVDSLNETVITFDGALAELVESVAGATGSTPPEISVIDGVTDGDSAFKAKIAWIQKSVGTLQERAAQADHLEQEIAVAAREMREQEVRHLLAEVLPQDEVEALVKIGASKSDDDYTEWFTEKELFVLHLKGTAKVEPKGGSGESSTILAELVKRLRTEGDEGYLQPDSGFESGTPADVLRTQRYKIAGNATDVDPAKVLDHLEEERAVNFAGARQGEGEQTSEENGFRTLARELVGTQDEDDE